MVMPAEADLRERIEQLVKHLWRSLVDVVPQQAQRIDDLCDEMRRALQNRFEARKLEVDGFCRELEALNPLAILRRGYSVTMTEDGRTAIRHTDQLKTGVRLKTRLAQGEFLSRVEEVIT
jgi:exodeoxyribonuclease VII large subunit